MTPFAYSLPQYMPDRPALGNQGLTVANNCIPADVGYRPHPGPVPTNIVLEGPCRGSFSAVDSSGTSHRFAGDPARLYRLSDSAAVSVGQPGGYSLASDHFWEFTKFGEQVIAVNPATPPQVHHLGTAGFANLAGTPPAARHVATIRDFVVLGNVQDGGDRPQRLHWSAFNDAEGWTPGEGQSDFQDLFGNGGAIQYIAGGEYGIIFQERAIWRMTYEGPPAVFRFDELERDRGTRAPNSVCQIGQRIYYLGHDGFYMFDGTRSTAIGEGRVDRTFFSRVDRRFLHNVRGTVDPLQKLIYWLYPTESDTGNAVLIYNWAWDKWSTVALTAEHLTVLLSSGFTLEELDNVSANTDLLPAPLDNSYYVGGDYILALFDKDHRLTTLTGDALPVRIESQEWQFNPGGESLVTEVRPLGQGAFTMSLGHRNQQTDNVNWTAPQPVNDIGVADFLCDARFHRLRMDIAGAGDIFGATITASKSGGR